jgi:hypothetical protein
MMGKSLELIQVPNTFPRSLTTFMMRCLTAHLPVLVQPIFMIMYWKMMCLTLTLTELLFEKQAEMMDMAADSKIMIFSPTKKAVQAWRHPGTNPSHDLESVCTEPTVDTYDSLAYTNEDESFCLYFQRFLDSFLISKWSWMLVWMSCFGPIQVTIALW